MILMVDKNNILKGCPMPNLTISPYWEEVATEKRNLDPLAGRLLLFVYDQP